MKISVEIIDNRGFWFLRRGKSKSLVIKWLKLLEKGTEIKWKSNNSVFVSQQYLMK